MKSSLPMLACLLIGTPAFASAPPRKQPQPQELAPRSGQTSGQARPCQEQAPQRSVWPQGTLLWGTGRKVVTEEMSSVLASVTVDQAQLGGTPLKSVRIEDGRLVAPSVAPEKLVGAVFQGTASDGQPVDVALCGAEPSSTGHSMVWYHIEIRNRQGGSWENPCVATGRVPEPRALAVQGVWDGTGARHEVPGKFTFACENGAIAKCIEWGYKPWGTKAGRSLVEVHQACTRMARADYCGDGRSHTREDNPIDMYDELGVSARTTQASRSWVPERASFEAAWTPEGAWCMAHTRDGQKVETILAQCPDRFEVASEDLGQGDRCAVRRKEGRSETALLRNHSYGKIELNLP